MTVPRTKTDPNHKAKFSYGVQCSCSCGWQSSMWNGTGARRNAAEEWRWHKSKCQADDAATDTKQEQE